MATGKSAMRIYEFGPFRMDVNERLLLLQGRQLSLQPKIFDTLRILVENSGHVLAKQDLMDAVWPDAAVEEGNLTHNISILRKTLRATPDNPYIETVAKLGYRFVAEVREAEAEAERLPGAGERVLPAQQERPSHISMATALSRGTAAAGSGRFEDSERLEPTTARRIAGIQGRVRKSVPYLFLPVVIAAVAYLWFWNPEAPRESHARVPVIAVLPFHSIRANGSDEHLELGMADALITKLSNIRQMVVRPTSAVRKYSDLESDPVAAGRELRVDSVLEGSVQKSGDRIRVTVQLVSVDEGRPLWAGKFDEKFTDIFAVQDSISEKVTGALALELTGEEKRRLRKRYTENTDAYLLYQRGRYFWNKRTVEALRKGIELFQQAIDKDPNYALAYAGLADSYALLTTYSSKNPRQKTFLRARAAAETALQLDDTLVEAHATLAYIRYNYEWDWSGAERAFKRAIELNPNYATAHQWYAEYLFYMERFDESIAEIQRAHELDPLSLVINAVLGTPYLYRRQYDQAMEKYRKVLEMEPGFLVALYGLAMCYEQQAMYEEAIAEYGKLPNDAALGYVYAVSGRTAQARQILKRLLERSQQEDYSPYLIATVYAGLSEKDQAFSWLQKAYEERDERIVALRVDPKLDHLRSDPRFAELLRRVGLAL